VHDWISNLNLKNSSESQFSSPFPPASPADSSQCLLPSDNLVPLPGRDISCSPSTSATTTDFLQFASASAHCHQYSIAPDLGLFRRATIPDERSTSQQTISMSHVQRAGHPGSNHRGHRVQFQSAIPTPAAIRGNFIPVSSPPRYQSTSRRHDLASSGRIQASHSESEMGKLSSV
jgi:hypothetical protein